MALTRTVKSAMDEDGAAAPAAANGNGTGVHAVISSDSPHSLADALREASVAAHSDSASEEDYDEIQAAHATGDVRRRARVGSTGSVPLKGRLNTQALHLDDLPPLKVTKDGKNYVLVADDPELRDVLLRGLQRAKDPSAAASSRLHGKFRDLVFTRQFSAFDRQNVDAANSPFHGFFTLFWIGVFLFVVKIGVENWRNTGNILGTNEIMENMFRRDVIILLFSDGVMCGLTGVSWIIQRMVLAGYFDWDRTGWIIQNIWQTAFIGGVVGLTLLRDWPWSHTVYFVLHGLAMLMKQHSYAFYNGYLSSMYKHRNHLETKLKQLERISPIQSPSSTEPSASAVSTSHLSQQPSAREMKERRASRSYDKSVPDIDKVAAAIDSNEPLDEAQVQVFERLIKWDIDALTDELKGKASSYSRSYPNNLTVANHYEYIVLPTLVYELEYPRSNSINWYYVAEKLAACFGVIFVMIMVSQAFIYPVVMRTVRMKEEGMTLAERFQEFPWMLSDLIFPFMMEYLLSWYVIWETVLNVLAEITYFADRSFYDAWWNSVSWDQFARDWNRPVHNFLLRHVYHSSISALKVNKYQATLITFFLSACVHELIMWCIFKKLRGYLLMLQMFQLPLVRLSRTKLLKNRPTLGNIIFWLGIFTGPSVLCSLYLIL